MARFKADDGLYLIRGGFKIRAWKYTSLALDSHRLSGFLRVPSIAWGVGITSSYPIVSLSASLTSRVVAAIIQGQAGHPWIIGSRFLDKQVTGHFHGPKVWVSTPFATHFLSSTYRWNGL